MFSERISVRISRGVPRIGINAYRLRSVRSGSRVWIAARDACSKNHQDIHEVREETYHALAVEITRDFLRRLGVGVRLLRRQP